MQANERELVLAAKASPGRAREQLIETFLPRIRHVARNYRRVSSVQHQELMQEGVAGLLTALARYDESRENCFWTYAAWWVRAAMQSVVAELRGPVVLSDRASRLYARLERARNERLRRYGRDATPAELAADTDLGTDEVVRLRGAASPAYCLDQPVIHRAGASELLFVDLLADPAAQDAYEAVLHTIETSDVPRLRAELTEREDFVVSGRFGFDGPEQPLRVIAGRLGLSPESVRQIERDALRKMREAA